MTILSKYIATEFTKSFILILMLVTAILIIGNLFTRLGDVFSSLDDFIEFIKEIILSLPIVMEQVVPIVVLLSTISTFSTLSRSSEIIAMRSAGMSSFQMALPIVGVCIIVGSFSYMNQNYFYPWLKQQWGPINTTQVLPSLWAVSSNQFYYFGSRQPPLNVEQIQIFKWNKTPYQIVERVLIDEGELEDSIWTLKNKHHRIFKPDQLIIEQYKEERVLADHFPSVPFNKVIDPHHYPILSLYKINRQLELEGIDASQHWVEFHQKIAYPVTLFIMGLIGLSLSLSNSRQGKAIEGISLSLLLGIFFWISNQIFLAIGSGGILPPLLAAWLSNLIFLGIAVGLLKVYQN